MTRRDTIAGEGHRATPGAAGAQEGQPLATSSSLPLFPLESGESGQAEPAPRALLGVRRPTPALPRVRSRPPRRKMESRLSFESARDVRGGSEVSPRVAPPLTRLAAGLVDVGLMVSLDAVVVVLTLRLAGLDVGSLGAVPLVPLAAFLILLNAGYVVVLTLAGGQTFGKMVFGVRVVDQTGRRVTTSVALLRAIAYLVSVLPLGLGIVWMFLDSERRALHDRVAGTRVLLVSR